MEDIIGFLIIVGSIIISIISSVSKNKKKQVPATSNIPSEEDSDSPAFNEDLADSYSEVDSSEMTVEEKKQQIESKKYSDYERQKEEAQAQEEQEDTTEENAEYDPVDDEEQEPEKKTVQQKTGSKKSKKKQHHPNRKKNRIEEIQEDFDVEKGILYSEILNKKHF